MVWASQEEEDKDLILPQALPYSLLGFGRVRGEEGYSLANSLCLSLFPDGAKKWEEADRAGEEEEDSG